jgi:hypothetical protein
MLAPNGAGPNHRRNGGEARKVSATGERQQAFKLHNPKTQPAIRADLRVDNEASALGIAATSSSPVLNLCRQLIEASHDPGRPLEAWRNDTLCLRVRSIGEAAGLEVNPRGTGFVKRAPAVRPGPPARKSRPTHGRTTPTILGATP